MVAYTKKSEVLAGGTLDLGVDGKVGSGILTYGNLEGNVDGYITLAYDNEGNHISISLDSGFAFVKNNPATVNLYEEAGNIIIQNNTTSSIFVSNALRGEVAVGIGSIGAINQYLGKAGENTILRGGLELNGYTLPTVDGTANQFIGTDGAGLATFKTLLASYISDFDTEVSNNTDVSANTTHSGLITGNPHNVTQSEVGLGNVDNTADLDKPISTATQTAIDLKANSSELANYQLLSEKGVANGYATLDGAGLIPSAQLPSFVDDVLEYANLGSFPAIGETGKIYVALDTNLTYRWSGTVYVELTDTTAIWGNITGLLSNQTDLQNALNAKQNSLTFDTTPTDTSTNPVESNGIFDALALKEDVANKVSAFQITPDDTHYASEKLVKDNLDLKYDSADYATDFNSNFGAKTTDNLSEGITNLYDKTVAITGGTNVTVGGTYPNFAITDNSASSGDLTTHTGNASIHFTEGSIDHGNIAGLLDDDHTQYGLLAGRAGGQTFIGSTLTGENLKFHSNALKNGLIKLGDNSYYDEATKYLGINTTPTASITAKATTSDDTAYVAEFEDSAGGDLFKQRNDGDIILKGGVFDLGRLNMGGSTSGQTSALTWGTSPASNLASIGGQVSSGDLSLLSNLIFGGFSQIQHATTSSSFGASGIVFDLSTGNINFLSAPPASYTRGNTFNQNTNNAIRILGANKYTGFGILTPTARVHAVGASSTSADYACKFQNASLADILTCRDDGLVTISGAYSLPKTDGTANQFMQTDGAGNITFQTATASDISDFDTEVSNNTDVASNTTHSTGDGSDHSGVALLAGRAGGQTLNGGTGTGEDFTINSNPLNNGSVKVGTLAEFDEELGVFVFGDAVQTTRVGATIVTPAFQVVDTGSAASFLISRYSDGVARAAGRISFARSRNDTLGGQGAVQTGDLVGEFSFAGSDGANFTETARITSEVEGTPSANQMFGSLNFYTNNGGVEPLKRGKITKEGNLGVGLISGIDARVHAVGASSTSADYACKFQNASLSDILTCRNDGLVTISGAYSMPTADGTVAGSIMTTNAAGQLSFLAPAYGEAYQNDNAVQTPVGTPTVNTWYEINNFTTGENQGITVAAGTLTVNSGQGGVYSLSASISGVPATANNVFEFSFSINDVILTKTKTKRNFASITDAGSISLHGLANLSAGDVVKIELRNLSAGNKFTVQNSNVVIHRID